MRQNTIAKSKGSSSNISLDWDGTLIIKFPGGKQTLCFVGVIARPVATGDIRGQCLPNSAQKIFLEPRKFILKHNENNGMRTGRTTPQDPRIFIPDTGTHPRNDPCKKRLGPAKPPPHRCRAFPLLFVQMGMVSSAACECGAEEKNVHVVRPCPIHRLLPIFKW